MSAPIDNRWGQGWSPYHTGGGCMALYHETEHGYALITGTDGSDIPPSDAPCLLGFYDEDGSPLEERNGNVEDFANTATAMIAFSERQRAA